MERNIADIRGGLPKRIYSVTEAQYSAWRGSRKPAGGLPIGKNATACVSVELLLLQEKGFPKFPIMLGPSMAAKRQPSRI